VELLSLTICVAGALLFWRRLQALRRSEPPALARQHADVSVIVPARDEAHNLPTLLASLAGLAPAPREIIVVDDGSSDDTAAIALRFGARLVTPEARPPSFIGKPWACLAGARVASGRYLLFTDADTWHAPDSLARALDKLEASRASLVSMVPTHRAERTWERLQGIFQLLLFVATRASARDASRNHRPFAIGQYLLFRADAYWAIGGHAAVPARIAEDLALARALKGAGHVVSVLFAPGALRVRMYPEGLRAFLAGWRRNFRDGIGAAGALAVFELTLVIGWLLGIPVWFAQALWGGDAALCAVWLAAYAGSAWLVSREQRHVGAFPSWSALCYPLFVLAFVAVTGASLWDAVRKRPVTWRGRTFELLR
jgi:4,4'-diaponeurosporenoate glycosyltransferase